MDQEQRRIIRTIIFDLDGTLVDSKRDLAKSVNHALRNLNLPEKGNEEIYSYIGGGLHDLLAQAFADHAESIEAGIELFRAHYREHLLEETRCYDGIHEVLDVLGNRYVSVVTNKSKEFTLPILEGLNILNKFDLIISGDDQWPKKPAPDSICEVAKRSGALPSETITIGDHYTDILAGQRAGSITCWASYGFGDKRDLLPDIVISRPIEILQYI